MEKILILEKHLERVSSQCIYILYIFIELRSQKFRAAALASVVLFWGVMGNGPPQAGYCAKPVGKKENQNVCYVEE